MRAFGYTLILCALAATLHAQPAEVGKPKQIEQLSAPALDLADLKQMEVERLRQMAEAGAIPRARLEQAQAELADAQDNMVLRRTLYGTVRVEDFTKEQAAEMIAAAQRLVDRQAERYEQARQLVAEGVMARATLAALVEDLEFRKKALDLAHFRSRLLDELEQYARAEEEADTDVAPSMPRRMIERFDGRGVFTEVDFARVANAFQLQFHRPLPVSARGETATHRALGFDHRGRVDVALNPDQREGVWLVNYLRRLRLPYFAFRAAVRGKSTAPHIHMGPPSNRLRVAD
ncbi:MAG TPA: hypothetical protein VES20_16750 [Bryobacteraceae bacterium]|nr:hypothetical protein [Bryobacteraceae bacterium]